jgi:hypothetical protein
MTTSNPSTHGEFRVPLPNGSYDSDIIISTDDWEADNE